MTMMMMTMMMMMMMIMMMMMMISNNLVNDFLYFIPESDTDRKTIMALLSVAIAVVCLGILIIIIAVIWISRKYG